MEDIKGVRSAAASCRRQSASPVYRAVAVVALAVGLLAAATHPAAADSTGERPPSQALTGAFTNAVNAFACDGVTADVTANNQTQLYSGFGISLPPTAIVTGIQARLRANDGTRNNRRFRVGLSWDGGSTFTADQPTRNIRRNAPLRDFFVGGSAYLWERAWTGAELADANFRVRLQGRMPGGSDPIHLDCLAVTVFYRLPGAPSLNLAKTDGPDPIEPQQELTYTISYSNTGESTATDVIVTDVVPADTTFVSANPAPTSAPAVGGTGTVTWNVGSVPPGGSGTLTLVVEVDAGLSSGDAIVNATYSIDSNENAATPGNPVTTTVVNPVVLSLAKSDAPDPVQPGGTVTYVLTYTNSGSVPATGVVVSEAYDANVTFQSATPAPDGGFTDQWSIGTVAAGASGAITITATVATGLADGVLLGNSADLSDDASNFAEAAATTTVQNVASLSISKTDGPDPVSSGAALTYTINYQNTGTTTLSGVEVIEAYDANTTFVSSVPAPDLGSDDTWTIGTLAPGAGGSITVQVDVAPLLASGTLLNNQVFVSDDAAHSAAASASTLVTAPPCGDGAVQPGEDCDDGVANGTSASCCSTTCGFRPAADPCDDDGNGCTDDVCSGASAVCQHPDNVAPCDDGFYCNGADTCATGTCSQHAGDPCTGPDGDTDCAESCDESADSCTGIDPAATLCRPSAGECDVDDYCDGVDSTCADEFASPTTACGSPADDECTDPDTCDGAGTCLANHAAASTPCTDDGQVCTSDACDGAGACVHPAGNAGTECRADGGECDVAEACDGLNPSCPPDGFEPANAACGSPDDTECTEPDACDGGGNCLANHVAASTPCTDDGQVCTADACDGAGTCAHPAGNAGTECRADGGACDVAEVCDGANPSCPADGFEPAGAACGSSADTPCDNPDTCDGSNHCLANLELAGTSCSDGDACTSGDICDAGGACVTGPPTLCPPCSICDGEDGCVDATAFTCEPGVAGKNVLVVADRADPRSDRIVYRQRIQAATSKADFGNPLTGSGYQLCIYDDKVAPGSPDTLVYAVDIPAGTAWRETAAGFVNRSATTDPALKVVLRSGAAGRGRIGVRAKGGALGLVPHNSGVFFSQSEEVTAILLRNDGGRCFRTDFPRPWRKNAANGYRDKD